MKTTSKVRKMCFGKKKSASPPAELVISGPISIPFDYEQNPLPPALNEYSIHTVHSVPIPPPKSYSTKYGYADKPEPVPVFESNWRQSETQPQRSEKSGRKESRKWSLKSNVSPTSKRPSITVPIVGRLKAGMFRNAGLDEHGRLKLDYEALAESPDWGTPDCYRRPSLW